MNRGPSPAPPLLVQQHGLFTTRQARELGISPDRLKQHLHSGRWQRVLHGVHAVTTGPLTWPAVLQAALLYGGPDAALSHQTAAQEWGMVRSRDVGAVHITVPYGRSSMDQPQTVGALGLVHPGVRVHRSRAHRHIVVPTDPPRTSRADTAVDLAVAEPTARGAARVLVASVTGGRVALSTVRKVLELRQPRRYRSILQGAVTLMAEGVQSALEHRYAMDVEQQHGLPPAHRQSPVVVDGRTLWEDCDYTPHGVALVVRLDGRRYHDSATVAFRDRRRDNAAELAGRPRLVYGWDEVVHDPCGVAGEVAQVLTRGGWTGTAGCADCS